MLRLFSLLMLLTLACTSDDTPTTNPDDPSNLQVDILVYNDSSGIAVVSANADNTNEYHFYMDDGDDNPIVQTEGSLEYTYLSSGSYLIEVRAYGPSGRFVKKQQRVTISAEDPVDVGQGYSTPFSYDNMELYWNDEFDGNTLNSEFWSYDNGNGCPSLCGWGNNELEYYTENNIWVRDGILVIEAREEDFEGSKYTSGKIVTRDKQSLHFGRIDIRATLPKGQGIWPALWLLGINQPVVGWPKCGEIDIMEMIGGSGRENRVSGNAYWDSNGKKDDAKGYLLSSGTFADEYHVFSLIWTEESLQYLVDDNLYHTIDITAADKSELQKQFYMIMNVAVGGNWPGSPDNTTIFPTKMRVDYVRAFRFI